MEIQYTYYELWTTNSERTSSCKGRYDDLNYAIEDMENHCNWYCSKGTGTIYKIDIIKTYNGRLTIQRKMIYDK